MNFFLFFHNLVSFHGLLFVDTKENEIRANWLFGARQVAAVEEEILKSFHHTAPVHVECGAKCYRQVALIAQIKVRSDVID